MPISITRVAISTGAGSDNQAEHLFGGAAFMVAHDFSRRALAFLASPHMLCRN
jgi:hypothetical protein